jgi:hypothetical protein
MKKYLIEKRIAIFAFMAVAAYFYMVLSSFSGGRDSYNLGYWMGYNSSRTNETKVAEALDDIPKSVHWVSLKPEKGYKEFSSKVQNNKNGSNLDVRFTELLVPLNHDYETPQKVKLYYFFDGALFLVLYIILIALPIKFIRLMFSIKDGMIFNRKNVNRIRSIGIMVILIYIHSLVHINLNFRINQILFDFPDYVISRPSADGTLLVIGMAVLVIAEVLSKGLEIKAEQELTI